MKNRMKCKMKETILRLGLMLGLALYTICVFSTVVVCAEEYQYDALNRLIKVIYDDGSCVEYEYDRNGNIIQVHVVNCVEDEPEKDFKEDEENDDEQNNDDIIHLPGAEQHQDRKYLRSQESAWEITKVLYRRVRSLWDCVKSMI